jgi:RNA polymerase-binding protein DksA
MNKKDLKQFQNLLLEAKARLTKELNCLENKIDKPSDTFAYPYHMADVGTETADKEEESIIATSVGNRLVHIEEALEKLRGKTYGICEKCEKPIERRRLKAKPHAKLCIECKEKEEKQNQRR